MYKKPIIVFEGIEGSGKSFHLNNVANYLFKKKIKFIRIREPGGTTNAEKIRKLILSNKSDFNKITDLLLYLAARNENIQKLIKNNYGRKVILIDRFVDSTIAYQHYGMGISINFINFINKFLLNKFKVNFTFLNLVNINNMKKRLSKRKNLNRYDKFDFKFYKKVQFGFLKISNKNKKKYLIVNSNWSIKYNKLLIQRKMDKLL